MVAYDYNPNPWKAEARDHWWIPGQAKLDSEFLCSLNHIQHETLSQKPKRKRKQNSITSIEKSPALLHRWKFLQGHKLGISVQNWKTRYSCPDITLLMNMYMYPMYKSFECYRCQYLRLTSKAQRVTLLTWVSTFQTDRWSTVTRFFSYENISDCAS